LLGNFHRNFYRNCTPNVKTPEQEAVLRSIRKLIDFWRISPEELEFEASGMPSVLPEVVMPAGPKYRHPVSGDTWDGQGSQPEWLKEALTRGGYTVDELRCASPESFRLEH
jgi:DNA-binding protein H-NS